LESFNPDDFLKDLKGQMDAMDDLGSGGDIYPEPIVIPQMTSDTIDDTWFYFEMDGFFSDMQDKINLTSTPEESFDFYNHSTGTVSLGAADLPEFMVFQSGGDKNFDALFVDEGKVRLNIYLEDYDPDDPGFEDLVITLNGIGLKGSISDDSIGLPVTAPPATLHSGNNHSTYVVIDIAGAEIYDDDPPQFYLSDIESVNGGTSSLSYTLVMKPQLRDITLRGAEALKIGRSEEPVPEDIVRNIELDSVDDMLNAKIADGEFRIEAKPPYYDYNIGAIPSGSTYCIGLKLGYSIVLQQDNPAPLSFAGKTFPGLNGTFTKEVPTKDDPSERPDPSLTDRWISGNELTVDKPASNIIISADPEYGVTFKLFDDSIYDEPPLSKKVLPIKMDMGMNINELEVVCWKTENNNGDRILPLIEIPPINFAGEKGNNTVFIKSITFSELQLNVNFTVPDPPPDGVNLPSGPALPPELKRHIALRINCPDLGFFDDTKILITEENVYDSASKKFIVDPDNPKINVFVDLLPVVDGQVKPANFPYMEFGPVYMMGNNDITMDIFAKVGIDSEWSEAEIDLQAALKGANVDIPGGTFPKNDKKGIDMSAFSKYMHGITFSDSIKAKLFLGGPQKLIDIIQPKIDFNAQWEEDNEDGDPELKEEFMLIGGELKVDKTIPQLPGKNDRGEWEYLEVDLPFPDQGIEMTGSFGRIFTSFPQNLYFKYGMILKDAEDPLTVYPDTFEDVDEGNDSKIKALLVMLLPLEFTVEPDGYFSIPNDIFGDKDKDKEKEKGEGEEDSEKDLFGRKNVEDFSLFTGVNIKSLGLRIDFEHDFFAGAYLHFDRDNILFGEDGLFLGDGNSLNLVFTGEQQKIINENLIYSDIKFVFPEGREKLGVARNMLPVRIVVAASGSVTLDFDGLVDFFGSGN